VGVLTILCSAGDIAVEWDPSDSESVARAKSEWDRLKADGYEFYEPVETRGKKVAAFREGLGRVLAVPGVKRQEDRKPSVPGRKPGRKRAMAGGPNARREPRRNLA
jgi:hypothetical protein